jgi:hypothetical protein
MGDFSFKGNKLLVFNYLNASEVRSDKIGGLGFEEESIIRGVVFGEGNIIRGGTIGRGLLFYRQTLIA